MLTAARLSSLKPAKFDKPGWTPHQQAKFQAALELRRAPFHISMVQATSVASRQHPFRCGSPGVE
jgi:hypothetical protein